MKNNPQKIAYFFNKGTPDEFQTKKKKMRKGAVPTIFLDRKTPKKRETSEKRIKEKEKVEVSTG